MQVAARPSNHECDQSSRVERVRQLGSMLGSETRPTRQWLGSGRVHTRGDASAVRHCRARHVRCGRLRCKSFSGYVGNRNVGSDGMFMLACQNRECNTVPPERSRLAPLRVRLLRRGRTRIRCRDGASARSVLCSNIARPTPNRARAALLARPSGESRGALAAGRSPPPPASAPPELWGELRGDQTARAVGRAVGRSDRPSCGEIRSRDCLSLRARAPDAAHSRTA
jgi:hypothetical protein